MRRSNTAIAVWMLAVFLTGTAVGAFGHRLYTVKSVIASPAQPPRSPDEWRRQFMDEMHTRLKLDSEQVTQLGTILDDTRVKFRAVRDKYKPEMKALHDEQVNRIKSMLTESQRDEYARIIVEREKKMQQLEKAKKSSGS